MIQKIENITDFVNIQKQFVSNNEIENLILPTEKPYITTNQILNDKLGIK